MRSLGIVTWVGVAACYQPSLPEGAPCSTDTACPAPLRCIEGSCRTTAGPTDGPDRDGPVVDSLIDGSIDAPPDGPAACTSTPMTTPFADGTPVLVLLSSALDGTPFLSTDRLEIWFKSERTGGLGGADIWHATRTSTLAPWSGIAPVTELNSTADDGSPHLSPDRLQIWFASSRAGGLGDFDIYTATRATTSSTWSAPTRVTEVSSASYEEGFFVLPDLRVAYLHSERNGNTGAPTLFRTTRASTTGAWSTPVAVGGPFTGGTYENPWLTPDECVIYFNANRTGTTGGADLYYASRSTPTGTWSTPALVPGLAVTGYDADPWLSDDQRYIMYTSGSSLAGLDLTQSSR